jgi:hypothetical protein
MTDIPLSFPTQLINQGSGGTGGLISLLAPIRRLEAERYAAPHPGHGSRRAGRSGRSYPTREKPL